MTMLIYLHMVMKSGRANAMMTVVTMIINFATDIHHIIITITIIIITITITIITMDLVMATQGIIMRMIGKKIHAVAAQGMEAMGEEVVEMEMEMETGMTTVVHPQEEVAVRETEVETRQKGVPDMGAMVEEAITEEAITEDALI
ncbi:hypothetical protein PMG11_03969 [Penicillium brasilianum]|uniref:Uncharacterized protein n=1 Tax=Penicillium brasilianum TaxID=104259 RepID=A0A0F7VBG8_PENBI|nr:hypothetical protein PMG11_03969 [Penicillium brasilianum]